MPKQPTKAPSDIAAIYAAKIKSSGISTQLALKLQFKLYSPSELSRLGLPAFWAIEMPYFDITGKSTQFARYRYLEDTRTGFDKQTDKKPMRYAQESGTMNEIYLPPILKWKELAADTSKRLVITEGELKAACAAIHGIACVGLGGVWCFRSAADNVKIIPALKWIDWRNREVTLLYDSDAASNPQVAAAENALAMTLTELGARPYIARLPALPGLAKTGLDDYILSEGIDATNKLIDAAGSFEAASMLHELNAEVVLVKNPGFIVRLDNHQKMSKQMFCEMQYADRRYSETVETKNGQRFVMKSAPTEWLKWPLRSSLEKLTYAPGKPQVFNRQLNQWQGWGTEPGEGSVKLWNELLDWLFFGEAAARSWFEQWLAYPLQHPGTKLYTSAVMWSTTKGIGKSLIGYTMRRIYGSNFTEIEEENLSASHNEWAENRQFILADDVTGKESRAYADKLKGMITRQILRLNPKFIPAYEVPDCINYYFTSNHPDAFFMEDDDRRFFVHEVKQKRMPQTFYDAYDAWYKTPEAAAAIFAHLLTIDVSKFNPRAAALVTDSKMQMIEDGRSDLSAWIHRLQAYPDVMLMKNGESIPYEFYRTEDILKLYDPLNETRVTRATMSRELKKADFARACSGQQCQTKDGFVRLWVCRNAEKHLYLKPHEVSKLYAEERGELYEGKTKKPIGYDLHKTPRKLKKYVGGKK